jgi:hypothetical protein
LELPSQHHGIIQEKINLGNWIYQVTSIVAKSSNGKYWTYIYRPRKVNINVINCSTFKTGLVLLQQQQEESGN